jgi:hypothetical protein
MSTSLESLYARFPGIPDADAHVAFELDGLWAVAEQQFGLSAAHAPDWPGSAEVLEPLSTESRAVLSAVTCRLVTLAYLAGKGRRS